MATLAPIPTLHRDIRSPARSYKRDKDHSSKWAPGSRPSPGIKTLYPTVNDDGFLEPIEYSRARPARKNSDRNTSPYAYRDFQHSSSRLVRKADARFESTAATKHNLSRSIGDLAPHTSPVKAARTPSTVSAETAAVAGVLYSFDAKSSPKRGVGLESLVEKAEREWSSKETERMVKKEWEVLDNAGEKAAAGGAGKRKGKKSPKSGAVKLVDVTLDDEDDWERI